MAKNHTAIEAAGENQEIKINTHNELAALAGDKETHHDNDSHHGEAHAEESGGSGIFNELLGKLTDHDALYIGAYKVSDLPKIYIDEGFHFYWNKKQLKEAGIFEVHESHGHSEIVKASTGEPPAINLSITNFVVFQWVAILILLVIFNRAHAGYKKRKGKAPKGFQNAIEAMVLYVRDEIVKPNIPSDKAVRYLTPYFLALFFFILTSNLLGLIPGGHTSTGAIGMTAALAITAFFVINITAMREAGVGAWFKHLLGGAPAWLAPIMVPIEVVSMFVKPFALTIRLFANMTAGHVILLSMLGILFYFNNFLLSPATSGFSLFVYALELLVAFIQAYLFTVLTAIFTGLAIGDHAHEEHAH
jgi:F-type H+-transporting ATPase subunit a